MTEILTKIRLFLLAISSTITLLVFAGIVFSADGSTIRNIFSSTDVYVSKTDGYHTYRIPSLIVAPDGTLLAFCEGRKNSGSDTGDIDLLLKRSTDGGSSWEKQVVIWDDENNTCGNPCAVVDKVTNEIILLMSHNPGKSGGKQGNTGKLPKTRTVWISKSKDNGVTWSKPQEITGQVKLPDWRWYATGPGAGIQLKSGRLIIPCNHSVIGEKITHSHIVYSDDHGNTWKIGGSVPGEGTNECEAVELSDGTLLLNMRSKSRTNNFRLTSISKDAGFTWTPAVLDKVLIEPVCQASIRKVERKNKPDIILFSNPADMKRRRKLTLRLSYDDCRSWPLSYMLTTWYSAYSCIASTDNDVMLLFETGKKYSSEKIIFLKTSLAILEK
ncbi:MAG: sialidase family protein [Elusimicrobiota bacterium]